MADVSRMIDIVNEQSQGTNRTEHLTASRWKSCDRAMWFTLRNASRIEHPAKRLRTFALGHAIEAMMVGWLEGAGIKIREQQRELYNRWGKPIGHIDGIGSIEKDHFLVEIKSANNKSFNAMVKTGLPDYYYAQVQIYMHKLPANITRCLFCVMNKDTSEILCIWVDYDERYATAQIERMEGIIESESLPAATEDYRCAMCDHQYACKGESPAQINCRTCANVSAVDGGFYCPHGDSVCENYITHPQLMGLMGYEVVGVNQQRMAIDYGQFTMAPAGTKNTITAEQFYILRACGKADETSLALVMGGADVYQVANAP